ncbi:hypothetical protein NEMBOFW57_001119 [Staphylotrichum longicolle]|uniref:Peptidase S8/S53 domain-containing protein n=1 Tax=Staphylotrichum longicolle TaxID=669026 RepID=A0AAD4HXL8_9PEZI|nr:hypothetical protein NEMBOFW57_001119 [Staphylotrichum longicolle]
MNICTVIQESLEDQRSLKMFLSESCDTKIIEAYNPYFTCPLEQSGTDPTKKYSQLVKFGELLLEIALGQPVEGLPRHAELRSRDGLNRATLLTIIRERDQELVENIPQGYHNAMVECVKAKLQDDIDNGDSEVLDQASEEHRCKGVLINAIQDLEEAWGELGAQSRVRNAPWKNPNHNLEVKISANIQSGDSSARSASQHLTNAQPTPALVTHRVHAIVMSFGLSAYHRKLARAIETAEVRGIIVFAAASNYGGNRSPAFPAKMDKVLCIHASYGNGSGSGNGVNPPPNRTSENFTTLGVAVPSIWKEGEYRSGTSYAAPVAAGIAANVLQFAQSSRHVSDEVRKQVFGREGMKQIMLKMSVLMGDGYDYVSPWATLWKEGATEEGVAYEIGQAL